MARDKGFIGELIRDAGVACLAALVALAPLFAVEQKKPPAKPAPEASQESEESQTLTEALEAGPSDPQKLIQNLEAFLARFPQSTRRERVLRTIYRLALESNDPRKAAEAAEKLLEENPEDLEMLAGVVDLLSRQDDTASRAKAIEYGTRFIARAEQRAAEPSPPDVPEEKWRETRALMQATAYLMRAEAYARAGDDIQAVADLERSLEAYPTAQVAERLGDAASKMGETERAIEYYATAFAFPDKSLDPAHRDEIRKKLGSAYIAKHQSEVGLGDLILARYDELTRQLQSRLAARRKSNADVRDPSEFVLERLDGSQMRLAEFRGKVVVMDFWATWCAPCRVEGRLFEQVMENFRDNPAVTFLAVNVDENRRGVPDYVREENWSVPVVYARGLDTLLGVNGLPTVLILDPEGRVVFRQVGLDPGSFVPTLDKKVREALARPTPVAATSP